MNNIKKYPRVLIIYNSRINKADQHGVSIRGWFQDWPKEKLAQIYSGGEVGDQVFCEYNFKLGQKERRFGNSFFKLKASSIGQSSYIVSLDQNFTGLNRFSFWSLFKNKISEWLINTGIWELVFKPIFSKELIKFVDDFKPQIIYCQGYSLTFTWLPVMIHKFFDVPICFQTGDDWPSELYRNSPVSFVIRPIVKRAVKSLLSTSSARLANSNLMAKEYFERYGLSFETLMMCDNLSRFRKAIPHRVVHSDTLSIVYTGGLGHGRWVSIVDLCRAVDSLSIKGFKIMIIAFATTIPPEAVNTLRKLDNLKIFPGPSHEELPSYLKGADILFLPETFDPIETNIIRLSVSTKAHLYMMSERPILVYASPASGVMSYAMEAGWGCVVHDQNLNRLAQTILKLLTNDEYSKEIINKGIEVILKNHDDYKVKGKFLTILNQIEKSDLPTKIPQKDN